jgi:hypothetical protein
MRLSDTERAPMVAVMDGEKADGAGRGASVSIAPIRGWTA